MKLFKRMPVFIGGLAMLFTCAAHAAVVDGDPNFNLATDKGLFVWRTTKGDYQVRLLAGSSNSAHFTGAIESTKAISNLKEIALEDSDDFTLASDSLLLEIESFTKGGVSDGVKFTVPELVRLCVWDDGSGTTVYLGKDRVAMTAPVDLLANGACSGTSPVDTSGGGTTPPPPSGGGGGTTTPPPSGGGGGTTTPPPTTGSKFNPGHYTRLLPAGGSQNTMRDSVKPGTQGFVKHYSWKSLEPTKGSYDLSEIQSDLDFLATQGMQLIVLIEDKTFKGGIKPTPTDLQSSAYVRPNRPGGFTTIRWNPTVVARYKALVKAIAQRFDSHPNFEGMSNQETAPGLDNVHLNETGYSAIKYRDALIDMVGTAADAMTKSNYFLFVNFIPGDGDLSYMADLANAVKSKGVVLGSPDVRPDDPPLVNRVYPVLTSFIGKMPIFNQVEGSCYSWLHADTSFPTKYWTMKELFDFAIDRQNGLGVDYLFWSRITGASPSDSYDWFDALKIIQANPTW